jgi:hypothetical protein
LTTTLRPQWLAIHAIDGRLCLGITAHLHEAEAFGAACVAFHHDLGAGYRTELAKGLLEIAVTHRVGQIAHIQFVAH